MFNSHNLIRKLKINPLIFVNVEMTFWKVNHSIKSTYCGYTASFFKLKINSSAFMDCNDQDITAQYLFQCVLT